MTELIIFQEREYLCYFNFTLKNGQWYIDAICVDDAYWGRREPKIETLPYKEIFFSDDSDGKRKKEYLEGFLENEKSKLGTILYQDLEKHFPEMNLN